jgi:hypothetical protein
MENKGESFSPLPSRVILILDVFYCKIVGNGYQIINMFSGEWQGYIKKRGP